MPRMGKVVCMKVDLDYEQSSRLELLSLVAGKTPGAMLLDAAMLLLDRDAGCCARCRGAEAQTDAEAQPYFSDEQVEARFALLLGR